MKKLTMFILASVLGTASVSQTAYADMYYWKLMQSLESSELTMFTEATETDHNDRPLLGPDGDESGTDDDC